MKDKNGKSLKVGDHVIVMEGTPSKMTGIVLTIRPYAFSSGKSEPAIDILGNTGNVDAYAYFSNETRKLRLEELI